MSDAPMILFTCAGCKKDFIGQRSEEEAMEEFRRLNPTTKPEDRARVCHACFLLVEAYKARTGRSQ